MLDLLRTKDIPEVQMKLLGLIQKWGLNFEDKKNVLPNFYSVYNKLRANNVQFPSDFDSNYQIYISENSEKKYGGGGRDNDENYEKNDDNDSSDKEDGETFYYMDSLKNVLKVPNFEHKYRRLVNFLVKMHDNIQMANLLIDSREHAGLKDIVHTLREGNNTLIDTISGGRLKDEKLMEITLGTTEDINQTLGRDEDIKNGYKPNKFKSYFVMNNVIRIKNNNHRTRAKSTKQKKPVQRNNEKYKNYDMDINNAYDKNKYKTKIGPKNADDIFDLFSASNPNNEPQYFQNNNNMNNNNNINNFFNSQTQVRNNNNQQGYPQLKNNPMNNLFNNQNNNNNNNRNNNFFNNNNNNNNNNFQGRFNQNNNQQRPVMTNFDILEQKLNNLNIEQNQNNYNTYYNGNNQNMQFNNQGYNNNNNNMNNNNNFGNNNNNNNKNNNLMAMLEQLGPSPQGNSNQLVPYIGSFNDNNQNNQNNNNNQFNNFNNNNNYGNNQNNNQFNNFNNNNNYGNNQNNNYGNNQNNNFNFNNNNNNQNENNMFNSQMINNGNNNMGLSMNMNKVNMSQNIGNNNMGNSMDNNMGNNMNINMNNNNNWMNQGNQNNQNNQNNQQMSFEEMQKQQRLKELDDLF